MIDFRYHVVSIVAVFLALALGLFLGSTTLQGVVLDDLQTRLNNLDNQRAALRTQVGQLQQQQQTDQSFANRIEPYAVSGRLSGQLVVVVSAPGASGDARSSLVKTLERAGATVTADVRLQAALVDPKQEAFLSGLAERISVPGRSVPTGTGWERAAAQIADVLGVRPDTRPLPSSEVADVLATYSDGNLLSTPAVHGNEPRPGTLAVLLTGPAPSSSADQDVTRTETALLGALARDLDSTSLGVVVAGPTPPSGQNTDWPSLVLAESGKGVSTVRGSDLSAGRIATVFALAEQADGRAGSYGVTPGATPLPTPSP